MKVNEYKDLAKIQVGEIFHMQDIRWNVSPKNSFIELSMEMQWWTETNKNICYKVLLNKSVNSSLKGLKNI